jgi:hypothetical protein
MDNPESNPEETKTTATAATTTAATTSPTPDAVAVGDNTSSSTNESPVTIGKDINTRSTKKRTSSQSSNGKNSPGSHSSGGSSADENPSSKKKTKKAVSFSRSRSNSEVSIPGATAMAKDDKPSASMATLGVSSKVSDREQRSRRRQALGQEEAFQAIETSTSTTATATVTTANNNARAKRPLPPSKGAASNNAKNKKGKTGGDGEVLKVKLLTGTLFLYRGVHRHVEFIPRV